MRTWTVSGMANLIDPLISRVSIFVIPAAIALVSLVAFFAWDSHYYSPPGVPIEIRVVEDRDARLTPQRAAEALSATKPVAYKDTRRSESPFWYLFSAPALTVGSENVIELPSRHAVTTSCWDAHDLQLLGTVSREGQATGLMRGAKAGFALESVGQGTSGTLVCRTESIGPARISVVAASQQDFAASEQHFHRNVGLLEGGFSILAVFVLIAAVVNREWMYVLFAAWLMANLRLAGLSAGWDIYWQGNEIPWEWVVPIRKVSMASYYLLTVTLFSWLCREEIRALRLTPIVRVVQWSCLPVFLAIALPYGNFLPCLWVATTVSVLLLLGMLAWMMFSARSRVAMWYGASLGIALFASLYEVVAAALGVKVLIGSVNSVTAALSSSLMAAFAIAEQLRQERLGRLRAQQALQNTYEASPMGLFTLNSEGRFLQANPALREMLATASMDQRHWSDYFEPGAWYRLSELLSAGKQHEIELQSLAAPNREPRWFLVRAAQSNGLIEGSLQDISERVRATEKLRFFAEHDPLTGILNRRGIEHMLDSVLPKPDSATSLCLAYLDLDRFKLINDLFGHTAGDSVLRQVCERVRAVLSDGHNIGRIGGDEFVIAFPGMPVESATRACRDIIDRVCGTPYQIGDRAFQVKCSIGLVEVAGQVGIQDVISVADRACREAKRGTQGNPAVYGRGAKVFHEREEELKLVKRFGATVAPEGLFLLAQPIMSLRDPYGSLNMEMLLRMRDADGTVIPAGKIIPAAESNGRIAVIDRWVLSTTLSWLAEHRDHLKNTRFVCVNLSGGSLNDERFVADAFSMLAEYGRVVERLCIEITESVALHDLENSRRFVDRLRSYGAKVALDDFGAGYTSFSYLKELPADALKIDGAFVRGITAHPANMSIVEAVVTLGRNLGMQTIAEWAEDAATVEALVQVGADHVQGYAISRPRDPADMLLAASAATFIENPEVGVFVRESLASPGSLELWDEYTPAMRAQLH